MDLTVAFVSQNLVTQTNFLNSEITIFSRISRQRLIGKAQKREFGNPTFVIGDPMKKVHMGNIKSLANLISTNKIVPSYDVVIVLECII